MMNSRILKITLFGFMLLIVVFVAFGVSNSIKYRGLTKVSLHVIPNDASLRVDGINSKKMTHLKAGSHEIEAIKPGWKTEKQTIELKVSDSHRDVYLALAPDSAEASDWLKKNPEIQQQREAFGSANFDMNSNETQQKYPLISQLPYIDRYFRIDHGAGVKSKDKVTSTAIYIRASSPENRQMALNWIRQQGFDPTDYEIIFKNVTNPFVGQQ